MNDEPSVVGNAIVDPPANETAAPARPRPVIVDDDPYEIDACARMVPTKLLDAPIVALVPIAQYTLDGTAPFWRMNEVAVAVVRVVAVWKIHCGLTIFLPFNVSVAAEIMNFPDAEQ